MEVTWRKTGIRKRRPRGNNRPRRRRRELTEPPCLPNDILLEIFHRLPLKSIARFKSTCKNWNSILSHPQFMPETFDRRLGGRNNDHLIFINPSTLRLSLYTIVCQNNDHVIYVDDKSLSPLKLMNNLTFGAERRLSKAMIIGTCNGLVALLLDDYKTYAMCNPMTGEYNARPFNEGVDLSKSTKFQIGLCYDASCDEYILVIVISEVRWFYDHFIRFNVQYNEYITVMAKFKHGKWSRLRRLDCKPMYLVDGVGKVVHGQPHWIDKSSKNISYFDVKHKIFKRMSLPPDCGGVGSVDYKILGFAAMDGDKQLGVVLKNIKMSCLDVWVMKEYENSESWVHLFKIPNQQVTENEVLRMDVLALMPRSSEILIDVVGDGLWVCDLRAPENFRQIRMSCDIIDCHSLTYLSTHYYEPSGTSLLCGKKKQQLEGNNKRMKKKRMWR